MNQKGDEKMAATRNLRMSAKVNEWLVKVAKDHRRSVSEIIRLALEELMEEDWHPKK